MVLFTPIWMKEKLNDKQLEKAQNAVRKINNQNRLYSFAAGSKGNWKVKICAVGRITDQSLLANLACMHTNANVRFAALKALQEREQIIRVAAEAEWMQSSRGRYPVNMDALDKLPGEDYEAFAAIMQRTEIEEIRFEAARRAGNHDAARAFWENVFRSEENLDLRLEAIERMGPAARKSGTNAVHRFLMDIVRSYFCDSSTRVKAAGLLDDPEKSRQYAIAVRVVNGSQSRGIRTMPAAEDFRYITDAEVIGFVLEEGVCHDEIGHTALRCMYRNIDPNSPMAYRILETEYGRRLLVNDTTDLPAVMDSPEWMLLHRVTDREFLRKLAGSKEALGFFRWEACGMSGGHTFGEVNCACTICGFENHSFGNPENAVICLKCGSKITHHVYGGGDLWSSYDCVTHPDGTTASLAFKEWQKYLSPQGS